MSKESMAILCMEFENERCSIRLGRVTHVGLVIDADADVCIQLGHKHQCVIREVDGGWLIEEPDYPLNQTYLNRKRVPEAGARLKSGDEIFIWSPPPGVYARFYEEEHAPAGLKLEEARVVRFPAR
jgi:hypothetical protein